MEFEEFPKIPRLKRGCVITEKVDGSNAQIVIASRRNEAGELLHMAPNPSVCELPEFWLRAGSRQRWVSPGKDTDNFGFAAWAYERAEELVTLGEGRHYGEWYGAGIQRGYGLTEKRFALFNTARWNDQNPNRPACCGVVPVLYTGPLGNADQVVEELRTKGSTMVPGYMFPEGVVVYHSASKQLFKQLLEHDDVPKGLSTKRDPREPRNYDKGGRRVALVPGYTGPERRAHRIPAAA